MVLAATATQTTRRTTIEPIMGLVVIQLIVVLTLPKLTPKGHGEEQREVGLNLLFTSPPFSFPLICIYCLCILCIHHKFNQKLLLHFWIISWLVFFVCFSFLNMTIFQSCKYSFHPFALLMHLLQPAQGHRRMLSQLPLGKGWGILLTCGQFLTGPCRDK